MKHCGRGQRKTFGNQLTPDFTFVLGIEFMLSTLVTSSFACWTNLVPIEPSLKVRNSRRSLSSSNLPFPTLEKLSFKHYQRSYCTHATKWKNIIIPNFLTFWMALYSSKILKLKKVIMLWFKYSFYTLRKQVRTIKMKKIYFICLELNQR